MQMRRSKEEINDEKRAIIKEKVLTNQLLKDSRGENNLNVSKHPNNKDNKTINKDLSVDNKGNKITSKDPQRRQQRQRSNTPVRRGGGRSGYQIPGQQILIFVVGDSELLDGSPVVQNNKPPAGSLAVTQQTIQFEHIVRLEFNYLAKSYNDSLQTKDERLLPTPYSEVFQDAEVIEEVYSTPGFNVLIGGNIDSGNENSNTNPRLIFTTYGQGGPYSIEERSPSFINEFSNIVLAHPKTVNIAHSTVRVARESGYFPQYIEVSIKGPSLSRDRTKNNPLVETLQRFLIILRGYYHLISDFVNDMPVSQQFQFGDTTLNGWLLWESGGGDSLSQRPVNDGEELFLHTLHRYRSLCSTWTNPILGRFEKQVRKPGDFC